MFPKMWDLKETQKIKVVDISTNKKNINQKWHDQLISYSQPCKFIELSSWIYQNISLNPFTAEIDIYHLYYYNNIIKVISASSAKGLRNL